MDWATFAAVITAIATVFYSLSFIIGLVIAIVQIGEFQKSRKLQVVFAIFEELKSPNLIEQRRYLYEKFPENIEGIDEAQLKDHFKAVELALTSFSRIGYLLQERYIDAEPILKNHWALIWRCWRKSRDYVKWARKQRAQEDYFENFEQLHELAEEHRIKNGYPEPRFEASRKRLFLCENRSWFYFWSKDGLRIIFDDILFFC